jgi:outer membrane immunogenic protein
MKKIALAAVALAAMTGSALAADIYVPPVAPPAPPMAAPAFSWEGSYAGVYAGGIFGVGIPVWGGGFTIGHNFVSGSLVYGVEGGVGAVSLGGAVFFGELNGRVGVAVGATDRALVYAEAGVARAAGIPLTFFTAGGGVEFAINDRISLYGEAKGLFAAGPGFIGTVVRGGVNFHF